MILDCLQSRKPCKAIIENFTQYTLDKRFKLEDLLKALLTMG